MTFPHAPKPARAALTRLTKLDPDLKRIEAEAGPLPWRVRDAGFSGLLNAIVGQQISNQAASRDLGPLPRPARLPDTRWLPRA